VNQYEPKEKCIREQVGRNTKRVIKRERLEPNRVPREKERREEEEKKGRRGGDRNTRTHKKDRICIVCSSKRNAGIHHNQRESGPKSVGTKGAENMNQGVKRIVKIYLEDERDKKGIAHGTIPLRE
jgi:hypothetical protein